MDRIESRLNPNSDEFRRNREAMESLVKRLRAEIERIITPRPTIPAGSNSRNSRRFIHASGKLENPEPASVRRTLKCCFCG